MAEALKIRPLTLPEKMVDELYYLAKRRGMSSQELLLYLIQEELKRGPLSSSSMDLAGPSVKLLAKLPSSLDDALERKSTKFGKSANYIIFQAVARELTAQTA